MLISLAANCTIRERRGEDIQAMTSEEKTEVISHIAYIKDEHTGLCFAALTTNGDGYRNHFSITNIPCDKMETK